MAGVHPMQSRIAIFFAPHQPEQQLQVQIEFHLSQSSPMEQCLQGIMRRRQL